MGRRKDAPSLLDDDLFYHVVDTDGDTSTEEDLCTRCGLPRAKHAEDPRPKDCPFVEIEEDT